MDTRDSWETLSSWAKAHGIGWRRAWELAKARRIRLPTGEVGARNIGQAWLVHQGASYWKLKRGPKWKPHIPPRMVTLPGPSEPWNQGQRVKRVETGLGPPPDKPS